jgi:ABC-type antimicrobial peptide transport system permease subunit
MAIRAALGATPAQVSRLMLSHVAGLVVGIAIGGAVSASVGRFIGSLLYGVPPHDLSTLAGSGIVLAGAAIAAGWLSAWRASRIDPAVLLRES